MAGFKAISDKSLDSCQEVVCLSERALTEMVLADEISIEARKSLNTVEEATHLHSKALRHYLEVQKLSDMIDEVCKKALAVC